MPFALLESSNVSSEGSVRAKPLAGQVRVLVTPRAETGREAAPALLVLRRNGSNWKASAHRRPRVAQAPPLRHSRSEPVPLVVLINGSLYRICDTCLLNLGVGTKMTEEEQRVLEKWKRRAEIFRRAYREAENRALDLELELALKTRSLETRIAELKAELN